MRISVSTFIAEMSGIARMLPASAAVRQAIRHPERSAAGASSKDLLYLSIEIGLKRSSTRQDYNSMAYCALSNPSEDCAGSSLASASTSRSNTSRLSGGEERSSRSARAISRSARVRSRRLL